MDEFDQKLMKILRNRLKPRENSEYIEHLHTLPKFRYLEADHILKSVIGKIGKLNDLMIAMCDSQTHASKHYGNKREFTEDLIQSLENLFDYVEYLQKILKDAKHDLEHSR